MSFNLIIPLIHDFEQYAEIFTMLTASISGLKLKQLEIRKPMILMLATPLIGQAVASEVNVSASVIDADTIEIHGQRLRLHGVDAPEKGQECFLPDRSPWRCGQKGALALADFIGESTVSCKPVGTDRYGRIVANCHVRGRDIEEWLVNEGWAMAYRRYSSNYIGAEQAAKNAKRGIWVGTVQPPWGMETSLSHPRGSELRRAPASFARRFEAE